MATSANRDPPSTLAYCVATAIIAALGGYFLGQASSLGIFQNETKTSRRKADAKPSQSTKKSTDISEDEDEDETDEEEEEQQDDLQGFEDAGNEECKLVLVVRTDLGMTKGISFHPVLPPSHSLTNAIHLFPQSNIPLPSPQAK